MLRAGLAAKKSGRDTVLGYIAPDSMPETMTLAGKLERTGGSRKEFDLDAVIARAPQLVLVDELAHANAKGCRHARRYQDIEELLKRGIDVYTTVNAQNIESLNDIACEITGTSVPERIPDFVFDGADQVELIDIEPQELMERLEKNAAGKDSFGKLHADQALFLENLTALREIALRRSADRLNIVSEKGKKESAGEYHTDEHILVCLSESPSNARLIRTAARMASAFHAQFTALYIQTPEYASMGEEEKRRLQANTHLAEQLGAKSEVIYSDDIAFQIAEFARLSRITKVVIGRSSVKKSHIFGRLTLTEKLILNAPNLDVYIIPDTDSEKAIYRRKKQFGKYVIFSASDILKSIGLLLAASLIGFFFYNLGIDEANIITVYVLSVLLTAVVTKNQIYSLISSVVSVLIFNFWFTVPRFSLRAYDTGYPITFICMFLAAFVTGSLVTRLKNHARQSAGVAFRTRILFDTNCLLQQEKRPGRHHFGHGQPASQAFGKRHCRIYGRKRRAGGAEALSRAGKRTGRKLYFRKEREVAHWTFQNNKHAGATTGTFSDAKCLYLAIRVQDNVYGVVGIAMDKTAPEAFENSILLSILGECALALENEKNTREKEEAAVLAQNEQLRANLLRAISHDLRTPLTSISGNASNLLAMGAEFDEETRRQLYSDIYEDSMWLINLVENLLSITRLVEGRLNLNITEDLMEDVISEALLHVSKKNTEHQISVESQEEFILARMDSRLIVQVIINIVNNAIEYTPKGSHIKIRVRKNDGTVYVSIEDDGNGISDEAKARVFDMFTAARIRSRRAGEAVDRAVFVQIDHQRPRRGRSPFRTTSRTARYLRLHCRAEEVRMYE